MAKRNDKWRKCVRDLTGACIPEPVAEQMADVALKEKGVDCGDLSPEECKHLRSGKRP